MENLTIRFEQEADEENSAFHPGVGGTKQPLRRRKLGFSDKYAGIDKKLSKR